MHNALEERTGKGTSKLHSHSGPSCHRSMHQEQEGNRKQKILNRRWKKTVEKMVKSYYGSLLIIIGTSEVRLQFHNMLSLIITPNFLNKYKLHLFTIC